LNRSRLKQSFSDVWHKVMAQGLSAITSSHFKDAGQNVPPGRAELSENVLSGSLVVWPAACRLRHQRQASTPTPAKAALRSLLGLKVSFRVCRLVLPKPNMILPPLRWRRVNRGATVEIVLQLPLRKLPLLHPEAVTRRTD
jgi:hypothetical protein